MGALDNYIKAWVSNDPELIAQAVTEDCVITECYGPVYVGRDRVREWAEAWFAAGGIVHRWRVTNEFTAGEHEVAEWTFECTWDGKRSSFDGATIATTKDGLIQTIREYQTTAPLYEWTGTWQ